MNALHEGGPLVSTGFGWQCVECQVTALGQTHKDQFRHDGCCRHATAEVRDRYRRNTVDKAVDDAWERNR